VTTSTHIELNAALDRGYKVTQLARTLTWKEWTTGLFTDLFFVFRPFGQYKVRPEEFATISTSGKTCPPTLYSLKFPASIIKKQ
jgi:hypothetical protein